MGSIWNRKLRGSMAPPIFRSKWYVQLCSFQEQTQVTAASKKDCACGYPPKAHGFHTIRWLGANPFRDMLCLERKTYDSNAAIIMIACKTFEGFYSDQKQPSSNNDMTGRWPPPVNHCAIIGLHCKFFGTRQPKNFQNHVMKNDLQLPLWNFRPEDDPEFETTTLWPNIFIW